MKAINEAVDAILMVTGMLAAVAVVTMLILCMPLAAVAGMLKAICEKVK